MMKRDVLESDRISGISKGKNQFNNVCMENLVVVHSNARQGNQQPVFHAKRHEVLGRKESGPLTGKTRTQAKIGGLDQSPQCLSPHHQVQLCCPNTGGPTNQKRKAM